MAQSRLAGATEGQECGRGPVGTTARLLIRGYQLFLSPVIGPRCRHLPTCSDYAMEAISRFGAIQGGWLAFRRIIRCNPWGSSGYDPVPGSSPEANGSKGP